MPINNALTPEGQNALGAAFGYYPQLRRNRQFNDPSASVEMPLQFMRSRFASTMGAIPDLMNLKRSLLPAEAVQALEAYGQIAPEVPYGSQYFQENLPLPPQGPAQQMAGNVGSFVPMSPMEALQAARLARQAALAGGKVGKSLGKYAGEEFNATLLGERPNTMLGAITPTPRFMFVGNNSKAFNTPAAETYLKMEKADATPEQMWATTGTFRGADGKLRQEISDVPAQLLNKQKNFEGKLHETLSHPELFKNYPALQYYDTDITSEIALPEHMKKTLIGRGGGSFTQKDFVTREPKITAKAYSDEDKKTLIHEIQHAIQAKEGFARGGNIQEFQSGPMFNPVAKELNADLSKVLTGGYTAKPEEVISSIKYGNPQEIQSIVKKYGFDNVDDALSFLSAEDMKRTPFGQYQRLAGEAEARATEARLNLTDKERRAKFPYESYDIPLNQLIIRK